MPSSPLTYAEVFAGAGGLSLGLHRAGMRCAFHAEIASFPRRVLAYRFPDTPLLSDVRALSGGRKMAAWMRANYGGRIDLLAGGSPCQDLSVAGNRAGLAGARSSLFFRQVRLWRVLGCPYFLWENVAGALSSNSGADFAAILSAIVGATVAVPSGGWGGDESGGGVAAGPRAVAAWRLLDAQWFGVPQRRLRVFVLGARAGGCDPAEVLLEPASLYRNPPTRREARQVAPSLSGSGAGTARTGSARTESELVQVQALSFGWQNSPSQGDTVLGESVTHALTHEGHDASEDGTGRGTPIVMASGQANAEIVRDGSPSLTALHEAPVLFSETPVASLGCRSNPDSSMVKGGHVVPALHGIPRRLMPIECERLMSWPDHWTNIPGASDAARYKACGNGVVSNVAQWIAERLLAVHSAIQESA